jgi:hypothetical protein
MKYSPFVKAGKWRLVRREIGLLLLRKRIFIAGQGYSGTVMESSPKAEGF